MDTNTRQTKRAPVTLKIKFKSATIDQFIERYAVDVSPGGIFIRTKEPLGVGTLMRFEFQLRDATSLITGDGTVVWTRENDPSRPNAAPGMGVRFDRLGDGSQQVLDRILAEKARQPTGASAAEAPRGFPDVPTRVSPAPPPGALAAELSPRLGNMAPKAGFGDERTDNTPLPGPMPFHSDAEEYTEEAFEEATKVRSLEDLVAQTSLDRAGRRRARAGEAQAEADGSLGASLLRATHKAGGETKSSVDAKSAAEVTPAAEAKSATDGNPAAEAKSVADEQATVAANLSAGATPRIEAKAVATPGTEAKPATNTKPGAEAKKTTTAIAADAKPAKAGVSGKATSRPGVQAARANVGPAKVATPPSSKSSTGVIIGLATAAVASAAIWFLVLRDPEMESSGDGVGVPAAGAGSTAPVAASGTHPAVAADAAVTAVVNDAVGAAVATGTVEIKANVAGARIEVVGVGAGPSPYQATLEPGKTYKAQVTADTYQPVEIEVELGKSVPVVTLVPSARVVRVTSEPVGAMVLIDGQSTGKRTPAEVTLSAGQIAGEIRLGLRSPGYAPYNQVIAPREFASNGPTMVAAIHAGLLAAKVASGGNPGNRSARPGPTGTKNSGGTAATAGGTEPDEPTPSWGVEPPPPTTKPVTGTAEPTPDWMK